MNNLVVTRNCAQSWIIAIDRPSLGGRFVAFFVFAALLVGCTAVRYGDARRSLSRGDYADAVSRLEAERELDATGWSLLAESRMYAEDYPGVVTAAQNAAKLSEQYRPRVSHFVQQSFIWQLSAATKSYEAGDDPEAARRFGELLVFGKGALEFLTPEQRTALERATGLAAAVSIRLKEYPNARAQMESLQSAWQDDPALLEQLAIIYDKMGDAANCARTCERALILTPENRNLLGLRAQSYRKLGETSNALNAHRDALAKSPGSAVLSRNIGVLLYDLEDWVQARYYLEPTERENDDSLAVLALIAECYYHEGNSKQALGCYQRLVKAEPTRAAYFRGLGACYRLNGDAKQSDAAFAEARRLDGQGSGSVPDTSGARGLDASLPATGVQK
jgi:tetratricopeptide (TPR) repeat protein